MDNELIDITEQIVPEEEPKFFNDEETLEEGLDEWTINKLQFYAGIKP